MSLSLKMGLSLNSNRYAGSNIFISTWKTDNTSTGSSANNQVKLPLVSSGTYNFVVDWGDGNNDTITSYNQAEVTHTYSSIGTYQIKIDGIIKGFKFAYSGDKLKILSINNWGNLNCGNEGSYFYGCENLTIQATDKLKIDNMTNFSYFWRLCSFMNYDFSYLDTSNITNMYSFLRTCLSFNQDISILNYESVTDMNYMLYESTLWSTENYDKFLISCSNQDVQIGVPFRCSTSYTLGGEAETARNYLINTKFWTITDLGGV